MISAIINVLQQLAPETGNDYGLCTQEQDSQGKKHVVQYVGGGQGQRVDSESFSYWRITGPVKQTDAEDGTGCSTATKFVIPLRYVLCGERDTCGTGQLSGAVRDMRARRTTKAIERTFQAIDAKIASTSIELDPARARTEFVGKPVPLHLSITYADLLVEVTASDACLLECEPIGVNVPAY